ncbi:MAG: branched-chain amino acid ABC transporter permease [Anaerolineales bacterium]|nr:branched-chain amino acid ABC transporter permease [Anaerolineales bacterium]
MATLIVSQIFVGLVSGVILVLMAMGLALIFGHIRAVNFAHGAFYMLGAYAGVEIAVRFNIGFWPSLIFVPLVMGILGVLVERLVVHRLYGRSLQDLLLLTYGMSFIIVEAIRMIYGPIGSPYDIPAGLTGARRVGDYVFPDYFLFVALWSIVIIVLVYLFLERTDIGLIIRAGTKDNIMVRALGVDFDRTRTLVYGVGIALAGLAGLLAAPRSGVNPDMGADILIFALVTVVIGGLGSFWGAVLAGLLIGVAQSVISIYYPQLAQIIVFVLMAVVLLFRPHGLLGTE